MSRLFQIAPTFTSIFKRVLRTSIYSRCYSTEHALKKIDDDERTKELLKDFERVSEIFTKKKAKKPQKPPFLKNIFLGTFDNDMLTYPELEKDELEKLNKDIETTQNYFSTLPEQQKPTDLKSDFMENLRRLRLFGLQGPQTLNARECDVTENCRFNEILSTNSSTTMGLLCNDKLVFQALLKYGSEDIKQKYIRNLIAGSSLGALCIHEPPNKKRAEFDSSATFSKEKNVWVINGEKTCIVNGSIADLLIVLAKTDLLNKNGMIDSKLTLFMVEKNFDGVTTQPCDAIGLAGTDISNIKFNNTPVPPENILGRVHEAHAVLPSVLTDFRLATGVACTGILRQLINKTVTHCRETSIEQKTLADADYIQSVVAHQCMQLYAMESMMYLTSLMMDQYENQDCQLEAIAVKIFCSQQTSLATLKVMELLGPAGYMKDNWCNILHRDSLSYLSLHEPSENLKLALVLLGLQYAGVNFQEHVKKIRNPLFYPADVMKRLWYKRKQFKDDPALTLHLHEHLHPSLNQSSKSLEYGILKFEFAIENIFIRLGKEVVNSHMELMRLSESLIDIYAMTACLGRASRAYCIGLKNAELEMAIAHTFCCDTIERVRDRLNKVCNGPYSSNDENYKKVAAGLFKEREYFPVHPLSRNY